MSRYIDADAMSGMVRYVFSYSKQQAVKDYVLDIMSHAPSIDIVFCKECKHRGICFGKLVQGIEVVQLNFCSYGEREGE